MKSPTVRAALLLGLAVLWLAATIWIRPLAMPDEGRYVGVARAMVLSGDWLVPRLDGLPFFHKPPLFYWISAAAMALFGIHEWSARLAPVAGAVLMCTALFLFARRWDDARTARLALLVLATQPMFFAAAQYANLDQLVAGCIAATILLGAHAVLAFRAGQPHRGAVVAAWAFAALGVLAKGLIGAALPALVLLLWLLPMRSWRVFTLLLWWPAPLLFLGIAAPWFVAMQLRFPDFFDYFFVEQQFRRFTETGFNNPQPWWFYPVVLVALILPWSAWLPAACRQGWRKRTGAGSLRGLMWIWTAAIVAFFSLPSSKLVGYVLPVLAPLAFVIADAAVPLLDRSRLARRSWAVSAFAAVTICLGLAIASFWLQPGSSQSIGRAIEAGRKPGEPVVFVDGNFYDVPFYAHLTEPIVLVGHWGSADWIRPDGWARELADAARFEPAAAAAVLRKPGQLPPLLCAAPRVWLVGAPVSPRSYRFLGNATALVHTPKAVLWRLDIAGNAALSAELQCAASANASDRAPRAAANP